MTDLSPKSTPSLSSSVLWGGRFSDKPASAMQAINVSIETDKRLWREDIEGSMAHAAMLAAQGIITGEDNEKIQAGLQQIGAEIEAGAFEFSPELEDIHLNIEARLSERIGEAGKRLHTARSRNDQVATDFRLWMLSAIPELQAALKDLQTVLVENAEAALPHPQPFSQREKGVPSPFGRGLG